MSIKFQYNKTSLQDMQGSLKLRQRALPTLQNKESALRVEVKKAKDNARNLFEKLNKKLEELENMFRLWVEFDDSLVTIKDVNLKTKKIAGVKTPVLEGVVFDIKEYSYNNNPGWYPDGIEVLKELATLSVEREFYIRKMELLDFARKKTTQKVNLYEKVQIPGYDEAIRKIKRFLEDEENLSKSAQKIVKIRQQEMEII